MNNGGNDEDRTLFDIDLLGNVIGNYFYNAIFPNPKLNEMCKKLDYIIIKLNELENKINKE